MYLLGYDIGTSSIKASIVNADNDLVVGTISYPNQEMDMISRQTGWAEQQPELWWNHLCQATSKLLSQTKVDRNDIKGIGLTYQMHGLVLIDKDHQVLRPSIIWCDSRAVSIGNQAFQDLGESYCLNNFLNSPGNFTASKLKWVKDNEPEIYNKIFKMLLPGDFINLKLTGSVNTTISGLSEGVLWNFNKKEVASEILEYYEIDRNLIPEVVPTFSEMGRISKKAAAQTGLKQGTPITYRAGDQPNNAMALNVLRNGEIAATCGTSGVVYGIVDRPLFDLESRVNAFAHVNYEENFDKIGVLLCINGAGIEYSWLKNQIALFNTSYNDMERMASTVAIGSDGISILPFGNGSERIFGNKNIGSHISNIEFNRHSRAHLYRASLESVAFSFVYGINIMKEMGLNLDIIRVSNDNMFQSKIFSQTIATLLGSHIEVVDTTGAVGAAKAAGVKSNIYNSIEESFVNTKPKMIHAPAVNYDNYKQAHNRWLRILDDKMEGSSGNSAKLNTSTQHKVELTQTLKEKNRTITATAIKMEGLNKLIKDIDKNLKQLYSYSKDPIVKKMLSKIKRANLDLNGKDLFEEHFDILNDGFIQKLKELSPTLTFDELKVCSLLKMNLTSKEIAGKLNLSIRGIETKRYRIRKKLNLDKGNSLLNYFAYISH